MYNDRKQKIPTYGGLGYYTVILRVVYKSETKNSPIRCYRMIQSLKTIKGKWGPLSTVYTSIFSYILPCRINETVKVTRYMYTNTIKRIYTIYTRVVFCIE